MGSDAVVCLEEAAGATHLDEVEVRHEEEVAHHVAHTTARAQPQVAKVEQQRGEFLQCERLHGAVFGQRECASIVTTIVTSIVTSIVSTIVSTIALAFCTLVPAASVVSSGLQSLGVNASRVKSVAKHVKLRQDGATSVGVKKVVEIEPAR